MDLYNSHARYNHASIKEIKKAIRDAFNVENKYLQAFAIPRVMPKLSALCGH